MSSSSGISWRVFPVTGWRGHILRPRSTHAPGLPQSLPSDGVLVGRIFPRKLQQVVDLSRRSCNSFLAISRIRIASSCCFARKASFALWRYSALRLSSRSRSTFSRTTSNSDCKRGSPPTLARAASRRPTSSSPRPCSSNELAIASCSSMNRLRSATWRCLSASALSFRRPRPEGNS